MPVINSLQTTDNYPTATGAGLTILSEVFNSRGGWFSVSGAAVFCEMQYGAQGSGDIWTEEVELGDGAFAYLDPKCTGVRFRSAKSGVPASITAQISQGQEPPLSIVALGNVAVVGLSLTFQHNDSAAGSEPIADFEDQSGELVWTLTDDVANTRMKIGLAFASPTSFPGDLDLVSGASLVWNSDTTVGRAAAGVVQVGKTGQGGRWASQQTASGNLAFSALVDGDTVPRYQVAASGTLSWGTGALAADLVMGRVDSSISPVGAVAFGGAQSIYTTSTRGFVNAAVSNSASLTSYLATGDTQPAFKIFTQGAMIWGAGGASVGDVELARVVNSPTGTGSFLELTNGDGLGYGTGAGGTASAAGTSVTLNKPSGQVTYTGQSNSASVSKAFTVTNSTVGADDTVVVTLNNSTTAAGQFLIGTVAAAGSFTIVIFTTTANTSVTYSFNFAVVKAARA